VECNSSRRTDCREARGKRTRVIIVLSKISCYSLKRTHVQFVFVEILVLEHVGCCENTRIVKRITSRSVSSDFQAQKSLVECVYRGSQNNVSCATTGIISKTRMLLLFWYC